MSNHKTPPPTGETLALFKTAHEFCAALNWAGCCFADITEILRCAIWYKTAVLNDLTAEIPKAQRRLFDALDKGRQP